MRSCQPRVEDGGAQPTATAAVACARYNRAVRDAEFVQRVRRHTPSSMLPLVARYGAAFADRKAHLKANSAVFAPWVLAEVARVSLLYGTEFNRKPATDDDLLSCCAAYQALRAPELGHGGPDAIGHFLLRIAGEQLTFQQSILNDLSRPVALLEQTTPRKPLTVATPGTCRFRTIMSNHTPLTCGVLGSEQRVLLTFRAIMSNRYGSHGCGVRSAV